MKQLFGSIQDSVGLSWSSHPQFAFALFSFFRHCLSSHPNLNWISQIEIFIIVLGAF